MRRSSAYACWGCSNSPIFHVVQGACDTCTWLTLLCQVKVCSLRRATDVRLCPLGRRPWVGDMLRIQAGWDASHLAGTSSWEIGKLFPHYISGCQRCRRSGDVRAGASATELESPTSTKCALPTSCHKHPCSHVQLALDAILAVACRSREDMNWDNLGFSIANVAPVRLPSPGSTPVARLQETETLKFRDCRLCSLRTQMAQSGLKGSWRRMAPSAWTLQHR